MDGHVLEHAFGVTFKAFSKRFGGVSIETERIRDEYSAKQTEMHECNAQRNLLVGIVGHEGDM